MKPTSQEKTEGAQPRSVQRLVRALAALEKNWPKEYWLFAAAGTLTLMKKKNGVRAVDRTTGGMDSTQTVATFKGIECDGGDW